MKKNVTDAACVLKPAMKVQLPLLMAKQNLSAMIIVTAWGIAFQTALPEAISFETREAAAYDEAAVEENKKRKQAIMQESKVQLPHSCPGSTMRQMNRQSAHNASENTAACESVSMLTNWPVQIKLAPIQAPYFNGAKLLIAADCTAYSYAAFHKDFIKGKTTLIGCPKLDDIDYSEKLTEIIRNNDISSVTIVRMEVPCCGGLEIAAKKAIQASGKFLPWQVVTISIDGNIIE